MQLNPATVTTDVAEWEAALQGAAQASGSAERARSLTAAVELYQGPLLPGSYEIWFQTEQQRLGEQFYGASRELIALLEAAGDLNGALVEYAREAVRLEPLREEAHREVMCLLTAAGDPSAALHQTGQLERVLRERMSSVPSVELRNLAAEIRNAPASGLTVSSRRPFGPGARTVTFLLIRATPAADRRPSGFREAVVRRQGREARADGAAFAAAFTSATDALACAVASREVRLGAGVAMHSGDVRTLTDNFAGDTRRISEAVLRAAHDGQMLCCEATAALLRGHLEPGVRLLNLGVYRLPEIDKPERLFQVELPALESRRFPPPPPSAFRIEFWTASRRIIRKLYRLSR